MTLHVLVPNVPAVADLRQLRIIRAERGPNGCLLVHAAQLLGGRLAWKGVLYSSKALDGAREGRHGSMVAPAVRL